MPRHSRLNSSRSNSTIAPSWQQARAEVKAERERAPQVGALPDPMLQLGVQNDGFTSWEVGQMETATTQSWCRRLFLAWHTGAPERGCRAWRKPGRPERSESTALYEALSSGGRILNLILLGRLLGRCSIGLRRFGKSRPLSPALGTRPTGCPVRRASRRQLELNRIAASLGVGV